MSSMVGLVSLIKRKEYLSFVASMYTSNNVFRSNNADNSSITACKSFELRNLNKYIEPILVLIVVDTALYFCVDNIVEIWLCLPRVKHEFNA